MKQPLSPLNRRQLLKKGALLTGSLALLPGFVQQALAGISSEGTAIAEGATTSVAGYATGASSLTAGSAGNTAAAGSTATSGYTAAQSFSFLPEPAQPYGPFAPWEEAAADFAPPEITSRLSANENPFGPSPAAKQALTDAIQQSYRYPFFSGRELMAKIAKHESVMQEQILLSAGSSPILLAAAMYFSKGGGNIITGDPSYQDLPEAAEDFKATIIKVPLTSEYKLDLVAMEKAITSDTKLIYLCNPNNPTATVLDTAALTAFCERVSAKVPVFIDEAYIDYLDNPEAASMIQAVRKGQNVIIARTFSKLYGFAGLRVGYAVGKMDTIRALYQYTNGGMSISATSLAAANVAYQETAFLQDAKTKTLASRQFLYNLLKAEGYTWIPSSANFVMFPLKMDAMKFGAEMMKRGVAIRTWKFSGKDWCRVSIGTMEEMQGFAKAFKELS